MTCSLQVQHNNYTSPVTLQHKYNFTLHLLICGSDCVLPGILTSSALLTREWCVWRPGEWRQLVDTDRSETTAAQYYDTQMT